MPSFAPISAPHSGTAPASTPAAEASSRPPVGAPGAGPAQPAHATQAEPDAVPMRRQRDASELQRQIEQALSEAQVQTNLRFRVDEEAQRIVVTVVDADTGETIAQIPDESALAVARRLLATGSGLLDQQA